MIATEELIIRRAAALEPSTYNAEKNSIQVVFSTGAAVVRRDFEGEYLEQLDMSESAVNLSQLRGAPVLDNHDRFSGVASVLGVVEEATVDGGRGVATLKLSQRPELAGFRQDVKDGIIRAVSAGYTVETWQISKRPDGMRVRTATRWTPKEISFTAMGADPGAKTRSKEENMDLQTQLRSIATAIGVPLEFADELATRNMPVEEARPAIIREAALHLRPVPNQAPVIVTRDGADGRVSRMADGYRARYNPYHTATVGREFANYSNLDFARCCLQERGLSTLGSPAEVIQRAMHSTSDYTALQQESLNKDLYVLKTSPSPITQVFKRATQSDFRARHVLEVSNGPALEEVNENGEIKFGTIKEAELASYAPKSYARGYAISFKAQVNDDMGVFSDVSSKMVLGARQWFDSFLVNTILSNPKLNDGLPVFDAAHGNLAVPGSAPDETSIGAGKKAMRKKTDLSGNSIGAPPKILLHGAENEIPVDKLVATLYPPTPSDAIVSTRSLIPIVEARLDLAGAPLGWYLFADPADAAVFEYCELSGYEGPQVQLQEGFRTLGTEFRVVWHVGAGAIDSRGAWKNPGA